MHLFRKPFRCGTDDDDDDDDEEEEEEEEEEGEEEEDKDDDDDGMKQIRTLEMNKVGDLFLFGA